MARDAPLVMPQHPTTAQSCSRPSAIAATQFVPFSPTSCSDGNDVHYLKRALYDLIRTDPAIFDFLQSGSLDGVWYWDVTNPAN